jgi:exoribonuclease R
MDYTLNQTIREDVSLLPTNLSQVAPHLPLINEMLSATWWERASLKQLDDARDALAPLMKYRKQVPSEPLELDLPERRVVLDEKGRIRPVAPRERLDAHRLVEDFMIAANAAAMLERKKAPVISRP